MRGEDIDETSVWVISTGEYSDYSVIAAFATRADAEAAVREGVFGGSSFGGPRVERLDYYRPGEHPEAVRRQSIRADIHPETAELLPIWNYGERIDDLARFPAGYSTSDEPPARARQRAVVEIEFAEYARESWWRIRVEAHTEELARKVLAERVTKLRSEVLDGSRRPPMLRG